MTKLTEMLNPTKDTVNKVQKMSAILIYLSKGEIYKYGFKTYRMDIDGNVYYTEVEEDENTDFSKVEVQIDNGQFYQTLKLMAADLTEEATDFILRYISSKE